MHIAKVIRAYFYFVMAVVSFAALGYNQVANQYYASVLNAVGFDVDQAVVEKTTAIFPGLSFRSDADSEFVYEGDALVNFRLNDGDGFAAAGEKGVSVMNLELGALEEDVVFNSLRLKLVGAEAVEKVYLFDGENELANSSVRDGYVDFSRLAYIVEDNVKLSVKVDVSEKVGVGARFRFDIEDADDLEIYVDRDAFVLRAYYPMRGDYLSISKKRQWSQAVEVK